MTERHCPSCRTWYDKALGDCPECGEGKARHNKWLASASLNGQLFQQAENSLPEKQFERTYKDYRKKIKTAVKEGVWTG